MIKKTTSVDKPDVLLIAPPYDGNYSGTRYENQGVAQLAAILRKEGWKVSTIDAFFLDQSCEQVAGLI